MRKSLRQLLPAWFGSILLPLPALVFWHSEDGRRAALGLFFIGCAGMVAFAFRIGCNSRANVEPEPLRLVWRERIMTIGAGLFLAFLAFSVLWLTLTDTRDFLGIFLTFLLLIPSLCVLPYFTLLTGRPIVAVVF